MGSFFYKRFTCGRWLGRGVDDGSIERLLVAELLPQNADTEGDSNYNANFFPDTRDSAL